MSQETESDDDQAKVIDTNATVTISMATTSMATSESVAMDNAVEMTKAGTSDFLVSGLQDSETLGDSKMKILTPTGMLVSTDDLPSGGDHAILAAPMLGQTMVPLSVVENQVSGQSPFEPGVILVGAADSGHLTVSADQGLLLGTDTHAGALALDQGDLVSQSSEDHSGPQDGDHFILQPENEEAAPKLVTMDPQTQGLATAQTIVPAGISGGLNPSQLQNLVLTTPTGETVQVIAIQNLFSDLSQGGTTVTASGAKNKLIQVPVVGEGNLAAKLVQVSRGNTEAVKAEDEETTSSAGQVVDLASSGLNLGDSLGGILVSAPVVPCVQKVLPPGTPQWASRLNDCERIGDSYRGWVENEIDLDLLLTFHKQQTHSFWGTRQSPSPAKPSTRLMWKSQYVPFDGIPFINAGSRAIVLECQHGPRRKTAQSKRQNDLPKGAHKQACPARIYIKKVKKYPEFAVEVGMDKKMLKIAMDKAFLAIKEMGTEETGTQGQERYYVQLPTEQAHEFHGECVIEAPHRLDPRVADKIRELVSVGETRLYAIRKALRRFVEKELFPLGDPVPEKHNLTFYPTVNDLQNHIHQAIRDMEVGMLPVTASTVKVEMIAPDSSSNEDGVEGDLPLWTPISSDGQPHTESVTVTLTQRPGEDGEHVISKVETHMSDGTTQVTTNLTPETARLLSKLHPNIFSGAGGVAGGMAGDVGGGVVETSVPDNETSHAHMEQLGALSSLRDSDLHEDMHMLPNTAQSQYVVMEEGIPKEPDDGIPPDKIRRGDTDSEVMLAADSAVSVVEIDPEMGLRDDEEHEEVEQERDRLSVTIDTETEGLSVTMDTDHGQLDSGMKLVDTKLVNDGEDLVNYGDCVAMTTTEMPVSAGLEESMDTSEHAMVIMV